LCASYSRNAPRSRRGRPTRGVRRDNQILTDDQVRRVVGAWIAIDEEFGRFVVLLAATGTLLADRSDDRR
jgi:hypothetical protein